MIATRYKSIKILLLFLFSVNQLFAQNIDFRSSNFKSKKDGLKQAIKNIKTGDEFLEKANKTSPRIFFKKVSSLSFAAEQIKVIISKQVQKFQKGFIFKKVSFPTKIPEYLVKTM